MSADTADQQSDVAAAASDAQGIRVTWQEAPRAAKAMLVGVFVSRLAGFIQIFLVLFLTHRGFSSGQAGLALGGYGAGAVLGTFVGGSLSDRLTPRSATVISMMGSAVLILSILYLRVYALLLVAVLLVSAVGQLYRPAAQSLITELTPARRLVMMTAMYRLGLNLGSTAAPLIGAALISVSYNLLFWGEALAALLYGTLAVVALPRGRPRTAPADEASASADPPRGGYLAILADWRYTVFLCCVLVMSIVYCQYTASLPLAIRHAGLSLWWYGVVVSLNGGIVVTCELAMTRFVQKWPMRLTALAGIGLVAVGYGVYAIALVPVTLIIGTLIWTSSEIIGAPTIFSYPGLAAPPRLRGRYIGAMQSMFGLGTAIGPVIGILLWNHIGQALWLWAAGLMIVATLLGLVGMRTSIARPARG